jgi:thiol-disulfide isomerase/thioredoxin
VSETVVEPPPTAFPRWLAAIIVGTIALASLVALVWPALPFNRPPTGPTNVGVIRAQVEGPGMAGRIGALAPDFEWNAPDGRTLRLSDLRGSVVVVNFWYTACPPCKKELPALNRVARAQPAVVFLAVDLRESGDKVRSFFDSLDIDRVQPIIDPGTETVARYGVLSWPTTFYVDRGGVIRHLEIGVEPLTEDQITRGIAKASGGEAVAPAPRPEDRTPLVVGAALVALALFGLLAARVLRRPS